MNERFSKIYNKILKEKNGVNLIESIKKIIIKLEQNKNQKYIRNQRHTTKEYICRIIEVLNNNISWRKYNGKIDG